MSLKNQNICWNNKQIHLSVYNPSRQIKIYLPLSLCLTRTHTHTCTHTLTHIHMHTPVEYMAQLQIAVKNCGTWWRFGRVDASRPEGRGFESHSSRHVGTLGKSFTHSCLWRFGMKLRGTVSVLCQEHFWVVVDLKRRYRNCLNEWTAQLSISMASLGLVSSNVATHGVTPPAPQWSHSFTRPCRIISRPNNYCLYSCNS